MKKNYVQIDPRDNVIVAITNLEKGFSAKIGKQKVVLKEDIKQKHKFALNNFEVDDEIFMYGLLIGKAIQPIKAGSAITIFNLKHSSAEYSEKIKITIGLPQIFQNLINVHLMAIIDQMAK